MWTQCWLNYKRAEKESEYNNIFSYVLVQGFDIKGPVARAVEEIKRAGYELFGTRTVLIEETETTGFSKKNDLCSDLSQINTVIISNTLQSHIEREGYHIFTKENAVYVECACSGSVIHGIFRLINLIRLGKLKSDTDITEYPSNPLRMLNHWDNMDGSIERGYSGDSFFFENNEILINERTLDYARLLASLGINGVVINNVNVKNAATDLVNEKYIDKVKELADLFNDYGVRLYLSLNYAMPVQYEPESADPLDEKVISWWENKMAEIYRCIPDLGGFLVKADSEGRPGPFTYGRTQADGANMLARAIRPYGGIIIWRCFVYNCQQDWRDLKTDRAKAGFDYFSSLDGEFEDNVFLQIKNGPMDFQPREPVSPLFGGLKKTNQILEVQIAQEYTGHQIDVCYLIPWFKEILDFETYMDTGSDNCPGKDEDMPDTTVAGIISGRANPVYKGGLAAVTNTGNDENWTGNDLALANLYGFGRLAYDTDLSAREIATEWISLIFNCRQDSKLFTTVADILLKSWNVYEKYTAPLGIGWMVTPHEHYGPCIEGYEYDRWGTYIRADWEGLGVERGPKGTDYTSQYNSPNKEMYASARTTPDELLLFFHKMPYTHVLKSGKTIIQHIYDTHFEGYQEVINMRNSWAELKDEIADERLFENVAGRFDRQVLNAREWCDVVNSYFYRRCGIPDEKGRTIY